MRQRTGAGLQTIGGPIAVDEDSDPGLRIDTEGARLEFGEPRLDSKRRHDAESGGFHREQAN